MSFPPIFDIDEEPRALVVSPLRDINSFERGDLDSAVGVVLERYGQQPSANMVMDFHLTPYYSTTMLTAMLRLWKKVRDRGGCMAFCNLSPDELEVLKITRLDTVWPTYASREDALHAVGEHASS
ncbi:MAG: STAS domain-containing protein [Planctomycetota bacterium]